MKRLPAILAGIYLVLVIVATIPIFIGKDALSGVFAVVLTQPWLSLLSKVLPGGMTDSVGGGLFLIATGALINAILIFLISQWIVRMVRRG